MATASEILGWIDTAIQDVLENGQHIADDGVIYTKADLRTLNSMREKYNRLSNAGSTGSLFDRIKTIVPRHT